MHPRAPWPSSPAADIPKSKREWNPLLEKEGNPLLVGRVTVVTHQVLFLAHGPGCVQAMMSGAPGTPRPFRQFSGPGISKSSRL